MDTNRIEQIQKATAYPESVSVQQALLQVWNETQQECNAENKELKEKLEWDNKSLDNKRVTIDELQNNLGRCKVELSDLEAKLADTESKKVAEFSGSPYNGGVIAMIASKVKDIDVESKQKYKVIILEE